MPYPALSQADAVASLSGESGQPKVDTRPGGPTFPWEDRLAEVVRELEPWLGRVEANLANTDPRGRSRSPEWHPFEVEAAVRIHSALPSRHEALSDREFWLWAACVPFRAIIERRYRSGDGAHEPQKFRGPRNFRELRLQMLAEGRACRCRRHRRRRRSLRIGEAGAERFLAEPRLPPAVRRRPQVRARLPGIRVSQPRTSDRAVPLHRRPSRACEATATGCLQRASPRPRRGRNAVPA